MKIQFKNIQNDRITVADDLGQFSIRPFKICDLASTFCDQYILSLHDQNDEAVFVLGPESFDSMELATRAMIEGAIDVHDDFRSIITRCSHAGFVA